MLRRIRFSLSLTTLLCAQAALLQVISTTRCVNAQDSTASPAAFIYVSTNSTGNAYEIAAFKAAANGKLSPVTGSPFPADVTNMAVNGKFLFGSSANGLYVNSFAIESNGALHATEQNDVVKYNQGDCGNSGPLFLDHTGTSLYDMEYDGNSCANNSYQSFAVSASNGALRNLGSGASDAWLSLPASFIGNNVYAYSAVCLSNMYWEIVALKRSSNGLLSEIGSKTPVPTPKEGDFFCPSQAAADRSNHVAITLQAVNGEYFTPDGEAQLATYTVDGAGNLSTTSTRSNMPQTSVGTVTDIGMAPSGKLLAVSGTSGLQIFHFNGSGPITHYTGLLTKDEINQFFWDNSNHLYAINRSAGKLFVFTVTPSGYSQAPGSPYSIPHAEYIIVQPR
jgi:hypothetical protein